MIRVAPRHCIDGLTKPDPREYASQIVAWAICWPWNLVWTLCVNNPFRYLIEFGFQEIRAAFDEISSGQFESIERDLLLDDETRSSSQPLSQVSGQLFQPYAVPQVAMDASTAVASPTAPARGIQSPVAGPAGRSADSEVLNAATAEVAAPPVAAPPVAAPPFAAPPVAAPVSSASPAIAPVSIEPEVATVLQNKVPINEADVTPASAPARQPTPVWTPPVQRPLIIEPPPTLAELTRPDDVTYGRQVSETPQTPSLAQDVQARRSATNIDEAGGSAVTPDDPWYSTWKAGQLRKNN